AFVTRLTQGRQVAVDFAADAFVRPMMGFQRVALGKRVRTQAALESRRLEFAQTDGIVSPTGTRDVLAIIHLTRLRIALSINGPSFDRLLLRNSATWGSRWPLAGPIGEPTVRKRSATCVDFSSALECGRQQEGGVQIS